MFEKNFEIKLNNLIILSCIRYENISLSGNSRTKIEKLCFVEINFLNIDFLKMLI